MNWLSLRARSLRLGLEFPSSSELQALRIRYFKAAVRGLPFVKRCAADPARTEDVDSRRSRFLFSPMIWSSVNRLGLISIPFPGDGLCPFLEEDSRPIHRRQRRRAGCLEVLNQAGYDR